MCVCANGHALTCQQDLLQNCQYFINNSCPVVCLCCSKPSLALNLPALSLYFRVAPCKPCSDAEILLAVCTSDFGKSVLRIQGFRNIQPCCRCFNPVSLLCVFFFFSGSGQHQEGGARSGALVRQRGDQPSLQTEDPGLCTRWREGTEMDWQHQDAPSVWGEVRRGRVPLHGLGEVWRGVDGLRPTLQRLPALLRRGAAAEDQPLSRGH